MINLTERTFYQEAVPFWKRIIDLSSVLSPNLLFSQKSVTTSTRQSTNFGDLYLPICCNPVLCGNWTGYKLFYCERLHCEILSMCNM